MRLGFITAMADEARTLGKIAGIRNPDEPALAVSGIGPDNAAAAAERLLRSGIDLLVSWGTAGALDPALESGAVLVYRDVCDETGLRRASDPQWLEVLESALAPLGPRTASGCTSGAAVVDPDGKSALRARTQCDAVDMETAAIAAAAADAGIAYAAVRVIVDPAGFAIPRAALDGIDDSGTVRPQAVAAALVRRPAELPSLVRLARWHRRALGRLQLAANLLQPVLDTAARTGAQATGA